METAPEQQESASVARGVVGGVLMGLANLVPGISGGTMLLAAGVYPPFIRGVAEVSTFRFRPRSLILLASVVGGAVAAIILGAGLIKDLVVNQQWMMYSLFIGLTLGGVPVLWKLVQPLSGSAIIAAVCGLAAMVILVLAEGAGAGTAAGGTEASQTGRFAMLLIAGIAGGAAMILPGVSGGYLLLVLGQYVIILSAIESARDAVGDRDWPALGDAMRVFVPVGIGVLVGVVGVSNVVKLLLDRFPKATLGFLLGLLLGAVVGLWPFQATVRGPDGAVSATEQIDYFRPSAVQVMVSLLLIGVGLGTSLAIARFGSVAKDQAGNGR